MRLILHIGANKTGTSAIQNYMLRNREYLLERGLLWPQTGLVGVAHYGLASWLGFSHELDRLGESELAKARHSFREEVKQSGAETVLVSCEHFMLDRDVGPVRAFFDGFEVEVIVVLRRHDSWWPSLWAQAIKTVANPPWGRSFESYYAFQAGGSGQHLGFRRLIETWEAQFPGAVRAIPYEQVQMPQGVVPAFLAQAGLEHASAALDEGFLQDNVSPRIDVLSLVDLLQRSNHVGPDRRSALIAQALRCEGRGPLAGQFLSGRLLRRLSDAHQEDYSFLDARFASVGTRFFQDPLIEDDGREGENTLPEVAAVELLINDLWLLP